MASVGMFKRTLRAMRPAQPVGGRWIMVPTEPYPDAMRRRARERRRRAFTGLVIAAGATLLLGLIPALRFFLLLHLMVDALLLVFVNYLVNLKRELEFKASQPESRYQDDETELDDQYADEYDKSDYSSSRRSRGMSLDDPDERPAAVAGV